MGSSQFSLSFDDFSRFTRNALVFLAPLLLLYLAFVTNNLNSAGFSLSAFVPNNAVYGAIALYVLNTATDFLRKFVPDTR